MSGKSAYSEGLEQAWDMLATYREEAKRQFGAEALLGEVEALRENVRGFVLTPYAEEEGAGFAIVFWVKDNGPEQRPSLRVCETELRQFYLLRDADADPDYLLGGEVEAHGEVIYQNPEPRAPAAEAGAATAALPTSDIVAALLPE